MKFKGTLIMALTLLVIGSYYFFVDIPQEKQWKEEQDLAEKLFHFDKSDVESITIRNDDQTVSIFRASENDWEVREPLKAEADLEAAQALVIALEKARFKRVVDENPADLQPYGLKKPKLEISLHLSDKSSQTLLIGEDSPIGSFLYVKLQGQTKVLMCSTPRSDLDKSVFDLRDKTVLDFQTGSVQKVKIVQALETVTLTKDKQKIWKLESTSVQGPGDTDGIVKVLDSVEKAKVKAFLEEDPNDLATFGLDKPTLRFTLILKDGKKELFVGNKTEKNTYHAKTGHARNVFTLASDLVDTLFQNPLEYLTKSLAAIEPVQVKEFSIRSGKEEIRIVRYAKESEKWVIKKPVETDADTSTVDSLLLDLKSTRAADFVKSLVKDFKPFGLHAPEKEFTLTTEDNKNIHFKLGNLTDNNKHFFGVREGESNVFVVETSLMDKVFRSLHDLRNKKLLRFESKDIAKIRLKYPDKTFALARDEEAWNLLKPEKINGIKSFIAPDILWTLNNLEFAALVESPPDTKITGFKNPQLGITLWDSAGKQSGNIIIGNQVNETKYYYAKTRDSSSVYEVQERFLDEIPNDLAKFKTDNAG